MLKHLDDPRVVAGFLKEAMFHSVQVQVRHPEFQGDALITDFMESSGRAKDVERILFLTFSSNPEDKLNGACFRFTCPFPHFVGTWEGVLVRCPDGQFKTVVPATLEIDNQRGSSRIRLSQEMSIPVLVHSGHVYADGLLLIENISANGLGGKLRVPVVVPVNTSTKVYGYWSSSSGTMRISGSLVQVQLTEQGRSEAADSTYQVGVLQSTTQPSTVSPLSSERRRALRGSPSLSLRVFSPINPSHPIELKVVNASVTGFAAIPTDPSCYDLLPVGCGVAFSDSTLIAELVGVTESTLHFQIIGGTSEDRVGWLRMLIPAHHANTFSKSATGAELIDLFCESGAAAAAFLKAQAAFSEGFVHGLASDYVERNWIHRWIERTNDGEIRGHICAVRLADNLWHLGDIAGMILNERRISKTLIPRFFDSFRAYCLSVAPCPRLIIGWNDHHPYWADFEKFLHQDAREHSTVFFGTSYHRFPKKREPEGSAEHFVFSEISAADYGMIHRIHASSDAEVLLSALDFTEATFGSPILSGAIHQSGHLLRRKYIHITSGQNAFLLIVQSFPLGSSQNRTPDAPWLIPLDDHVLSDADRTALVSAIRSWCLKHGYSGPGVLEILSPQTQRSKQTATKTMLWSIFHPELLSFFSAKAK